MLRINPRAREGYVELELQGEIASEWVPVLEAECRRGTSSRAIRLDFSGVTHLDQEGLKLVRRLRDEGACVVNCSDLMQEMLDSDR